MSHNRNHRGLFRRSRSHAWQVLTALATLGAVATAVTVGTVNASAAAHPARQPSASAHCQYTAKADAASGRYIGSPSEVIALHIGGYDWSKPTIATAAANTVRLTSLTATTNTGRIFSDTTRDAYDNLKITTGPQSPHAAVYFVGTITACAEPLHAPTARARAAHKTVQRGRHQTITGTGFKSKEKIKAVLHSKSYRLGVHTASAYGHVTVTFTVPKHLKPGRHHVTLYGEKSHRSASVFFTVTAAKKHA